MNILGVVGPSLDNMPPYSYKLQEKFKETIIKTFADGTWDEIASGGATGIDTYTKERALDENRIFREFKPNHQHWDGKSKVCPTPEFCYGFKARNMALAAYVTKLVCVTFNIEDLEPAGKFKPEQCYHCLRRTPKEMANHITHQASGGCWTMHYADDLNKQIELIEVSDW